MNYLINIRKKIHCYLIDWEKKSFQFCELGNLSIHVALRNLRPAGTKVRKIPYPTGNPFTALFSLVSCPNYTYEVGAWLSFAIMTQCIPGELNGLIIPCLNAVIDSLFQLVSSWWLEPIR